MQYPGCTCGAAGFHVQVVARAPEVRSCGSEGYLQCPRYTQSLFATPNNNPEYEA